MRKELDKHDYIDIELTTKVQARLNNLTKPLGSLGVLEDLALKYCQIKKNADAKLEKVALYVFAGDHGITAEGVAPFPKEVTVQMVHNMLQGGAAVTVMCKQAGIDCNVVDMGVDGDFPDHPKLLKRKVCKGTGNFLQASAMTQEECELALQHGKELAQKDGADLCAVGEMGIGNTSAASALYSLILGTAPILTIGMGTGAVGDLFEHKRSVISRAVSMHATQWDGSSLDALRRVGGLEIAGMTGFILECAKLNKPVMIDGFIASAAALCAIKADPSVEHRLFWGHISHEQYHKKFLEELQVKPILDLGMRLGEGTGAVLAVQILQQALNCYHNMATFDSAKVSGAND
jgi:nicotinate-nucleotide--dimethylbenzimidazole phosphoribosyltransferase